MLCGPMAAMAPAHHPLDNDPGLTAAERVLGLQAEKTERGLFKVPLVDGSVLRTHGPDQVAAHERAGLFAARTE